MLGPERPLLNAIVRTSGSYAQNKISETEDAARLHPKGDARKRGPYSTSSISAGALPNAFCASVAAMN
jgi:hypothetical protein